MSWSESTLAEDNIETVDTIELILKASLTDDWMAEDLLNQAVTITP